MSLETKLAAAMASIGSAVKALRVGKADDSTVLHRAGDETKTGTLTFGSSPVIPTPSASAHPVRHDDSRFVPGGGTTGQILTKASAANHALAWADPPGAAGGSYVTGTVPAGSGTVTITHNLGTRDVVVMVRETATYQYVPVANDAPTSNTVRLVFTVAPTSGQYRYVIFAALGEPVPAPSAPTAHATTHRSGGSDPLTPSAIGAAEAEHTHPPVLRGPWVQTSGFVSSGLAHIGDGRDTGGQLTVPALGYDWMPMATGQYAVRSDIRDTVPSLDLTVGSPSGPVCARGIGWGAGRALGWQPVPLSPVLGVVLSGSTSQTFYLWMRSAAGGGWTESSNTGSPNITVYALPV